MKIALLDHFDSFTYNLSALCANAWPGSLVKVFSPGFCFTDLHKFSPDLIVLGPGPGEPSHYPQTLKTIEGYYGNKPMLGVCLGLQAVNECLGGLTKISSIPVHGKVSTISFLRRLLPLPNEFQVMRYHSLYVEPAKDLSLWAVASEDQLPMVLSGEKFWGLQYHPESFASEYGVEIMRTCYESF